MSSKVYKVFDPVKPASYFRLKNYVPNWQNMSNKVLVFNGERNIGKSTEIWRHIEKNYMRPDSRFIYLRNNDTKLDRAVKDFNAQYKDRFLMTKQIVYSLVPKKRGDEIYYVKDSVVGYVAAVSTYNNNKSGQFVNVKFIFHEEYNEINEQPDLYFKWLNLLTTMIRFNKVIIIIVGNRDTYNNAFMVKWDVDIANTFDYTSLQIIDDFIYFFELGRNDFKDLKNNETIFYKLSRYDEKSKNYLDSKYTEDKSKLVLNYISKIMPTETLMYIFSIDQKNYYFGRFVYKNEVKYYFSDETSHNKKDKVPVYALNSFSALLKGTNVPDKDDLENIKTFFINLFRNNALYFNSFALQQIIELFSS